MGLSIDFSKLQPQDVLDLAMFAEREAKGYYEQLASWMTSRGNLEAAQFFARMAGWEQAHEDQIARRRAELYPDAPAGLADRAAWDLELPDLAKADTAQTHREVLTIAIEAETNAYEYYSAALEQNVAPNVEALFEELRQAELGHQRLLQLELARLPA